MKTNSCLLTFILSFLFVSGLLAQDKYEYATIRSTGTNVTIYDIISVTTSDNQETIKVKSKDFEMELLKKLNELNKEGWEFLTTTETQGTGSIFARTLYLRKKKN